MSTVNLLSKQEAKGTKKEKRHKIEMRRIYNHG